MITKEEAQEMAIAEGLQNYYEYSGLVNSAYKRGVEDSALNCIESCANDLTDDEVVRNIRALLEE